MYTHADAADATVTTADAATAADVVTTTTADAVVINILKPKKICGYCWHSYRRPF